MSFFTEYLSDFQAASAATGIAVSVLAAQSDIETGGGTSPAFVTGNNFAGVSYGGYTNGFPSKTVGLNTWIQVLKQSNFASVRNASGSTNQAIALGASNWAAEHYDHADWVAAGSPQSPSAWTPAHPGTDLISVINANNLTAYDGSATTASQAAANAANTALTGYPTDPFAAQSIAAPPQGLTSSVIKSDFIINGQALNVDVSNALIAPQLDLSLSTASTLTLSIRDPAHEILGSGLFDETSIVTLGTTALSFQFVGVALESGSVLNAIFEAYIVAALRTATGPVTVSAGQMSRTDFARFLVGEVVGAGFISPPDAYLYSLNDGYDRPTQETISRGTSTAPLEDSWTCLQRLASEIGFACFECLGQVYFGPYSWLTSLPPIMTPVEGQGGIVEITGSYDTGQPAGTLEITAEADSWVANIGDCVALASLGPLDGNWIVSEIEREDMLGPDITITVMQPGPNIPEPASGGAAAAVGANDNSSNAASQQTTGGTEQAQGALQYCVKQLGKPYIYSDDNPATGFDCSGLVYEAYLSQGINITRSTFSQWAAGLAKVPAGIGNLRPGDLVYFAGSDGTPTSPGHVAIVSSVNKGTNDVIVIDAFETGTLIRYDHFGYVTPMQGTTAFAGLYFGALRPAP